MPHPFFDAIVYPWHRADAVAAHRALFEVVNKQTEITLVYQQCGPNLNPLTPGLAANFAWSEILELLTKAKRLEKLCNIILADAQWKAAHQPIHVVMSAMDLMPVAAPDVVFLDRKRLRPALEKLIPLTSSETVLLVRGPSGSGKSWTEQMVTRLAKGLGAPCVFLFPGLVNTVDDVVDHLFTLLEAPGGKPPRLQTEDAWFRKVCLELQALAQSKKVVSWVIVDDIGEYPDGPRIDREVRRFFDQFALSMANPAFARWFRLVLLDYPDGPVPTKWRSFWMEDRPQESEINVDQISEFLLARAMLKQKQIGDDTAKKFAEDIVAKVNVVSSGQTTASRLKRIHDEVLGVLEKL